MVRPPRSGSIGPVGKQSNQVDNTAGTDPEKPILVAVKGTVFDVTRNNAYGQGGQYHGTHLVQVLEEDTSDICDSLCWKGPLSCPRDVQSEARRLCSRLE